VSEDESLAEVVKLSVAVSVEELKLVPLKTA